VEFKMFNRELPKLNTDIILCCFSKSGEPIAFMSGMIDFAGNVGYQDLLLETTTLFNINDSKEDLEFTIFDDLAWCYHKNVPFKLYKGE